MQDLLIAQKATLETRTGTFWDWLRSIDVFPKFDTEYLRRTSSGGVGSVLSFALMGLLMAAEVWRWAFPVVRQEFVVDHTIKSTMPLTFDISIASPCEMLSVVLVDDRGHMKMVSSEVGAEEILFPTDPKRSTRIWEPSQAEIRRMAKKQGRNMDDGLEAPEGYVPGCRLRGSLDIDRVNGRLMILPVTDFMGLFGEILMAQDTTINFSHFIHHMAFGKDYPGLKNPLNGIRQQAMEFHEDFAYFLNILPTRYLGIFGHAWIESNQYALTGFLGKKDPKNVEKPGLYFRIAIEPLSVVIRHPRIPFRKFLIHLVGILGGIYTCFGMVSSLIVAVHDFLTGAYSPKKRRSSSLVSHGGSTANVIPMTGIHEQVELIPEKLV